MATRFVSATRRFVPEGRPLPLNEWAERHTAILIVIFAHVPALLALGVYQRVPLVEAITESSLVGLIGLVAAWPVLGRKVRSTIAAFALVTASSVVVQFSGGYIEAHFHFFVVLALIALYQEWVPFLVAILYVAIDHGLVGTLFPGAVYNHPDAFAHPWTWAAVHAAFVLAESVALMAGWKIAENAQRRSDLVLDSAGEGILGTANDGSIVFANPAAARLAGRSVDEMIGAPLVAFLPESGVDRAEGRFMTTGGPAIPVEFERNPIVTNGVQVGSVVTVKDVSERKRAEADLNRAVSTLGAALESTTDGLLVIDTGGRITHYNQRFVEIWDIPFDILALGDDSKAIEHVLSQLKEPDKFVARVKELYADPTAESFDVLEFTNGTILERFSRPQRLADGSVIGRVWSFRDVTERKRAEAAALSSRIARPIVRRMLRKALAETRSDVSTLMRVGQEISEEIDASDPLAACQSYAEMGLGSLTLEERSAERFVFVGVDLFERAPQATSTTCHLALGFLCGLVGKANGATAARGTEVTCQSRGDKCCRFVIATRK